METGRVFSVSEEIAGTTLVADASSGATTLTVNDTAPFDESGGTLRVIGAAGNSTFAYSSPDDDAGTIGIGAALGFAATAGEEVRLEPLSIERYALVGLEDAPDAPILARVPHALIQRLPAGIRDEAAREAVSLHESSAGAWNVTDVLARGTARVGFFETDWRNEYGVPIIGGSLDDDVPFSLFGAAMTTPDFVMSFAGPETMILPKTGSGSVRRFGESGDTLGGLAMTLNFPTKITCTGHCSVSNLSTAEGYNVRFFLLAIDADSGVYNRGLGATTTCGVSDDANDRHRQVHNERQVFFDASPATPRHINWWWALQQDSPTATHTAVIRNAKMTLRISYAPDIATAAQPDRAPAWTNDTELRAAYASIEGDDAL